MVSTVQINAADFLMGAQPKIDSALLTAQEWTTILDNSIRKNLSLSYLRGLSSVNTILKNRSGVEALFGPWYSGAAANSKGIKPSELLLECATFAPLPSEHKDWPMEDRPIKHGRFEKVPLPVTERILLLRRKEFGSYEFILLTVVWEMKEEWDDSRSACHLAKWWIRGKDIGFERITDFAEMLGRPELERSMAALCTNILRSMFVAQSETAGDIQSRYEKSRCGEDALEKQLSQLGC